MPPRKKAPAKPRITAEQRKDWRNLPIEHWNVRTFHAYFAEMNRVRFGIEYAPMRNWSFEQGVIKRAIEQHGAETLRDACDVAFVEYRPTAQFPLLTAGFAIAYRVNAIVPRLYAEDARKERVQNAEFNGGMTDDEITDFL